MTDISSPSVLSALRTELEAAPPRDGSREPLWARSVFDPSTMWFQPLPANPATEPASSTAVEHLNSIGRRWSGDADRAVIDLNRSAWTPALVVASNDDPIVKLVHRPRFKYAQEHLNELFWTLGQVTLRIPSWAIPADGDDSEIAIYNRDTHLYVDLWGCKRVNSHTWEYAWGGAILDARWSAGVFAPGTGTQACGLAFAPMMVTPEEIARGWIGHIVGLAIPPAALSSAYVAPANRSDGLNAPSDAMLNMGDRLFLPRSYDITGLSRTGQIVARAAQEYGFIVCDTGGPETSIIRAENASTRTNDPWPALLGDAAGGPLAGFPVEALQVLKRP